MLCLTFKKSQAADNKKALCYFMDLSTRLDIRGPNPNNQKHSQLESDQKKTTYMYLSFPILFQFAYQPLRTYRWHCFTFTQHFKVKCVFGTQFFSQCWWPRESMLQGSRPSALSKFHTSLSKVLTLSHCVKVKQHYHTYICHKKYFGQCCQKMRDLFFMARLYNMNVCNNCVDEDRTVLAAVSVDRRLF